MPLTKFDPNIYCLEDLIKFFSFIEIKYMLEPDIIALAKCLDPNNIWEQVAAKLEFNTLEISWIPCIYDKPGICSHTKTMIKLCMEKNITIGTLLNCLNITNNQYTIQTLISLLADIMKRYLIDKDFLVPRLLANDRKKVLFQSSGCGDLFKSLDKIHMLFQINGFISCIILDNLSEMQINNWMALVDIIIIVITKNYKQDMENESNCSLSIDRPHLHKMSFYTHQYICNNILKLCKKPDCVPFVDVHSNENLNPNLINTKKKLTFKKMCGNLKLRKDKHKNGPLYLKKIERNLKIVNILLDACVNSDLPEEFCKLPTYDWQNGYVDLFNFL